MAEFYPIFLDLAGRRCLVAGLGKVGLRKLKGLLAAGCQHVGVFDPAPAALETGVALFGADGRIAFHNRLCGPADIENCLLVFAATNDDSENARIAEICRQKNILCDCASNPGLGSFISPAAARSGGLCAALSTGGQSPHLAGKWRAELADWLAPRASLAWLLGKLRPLVLSMGLGSQANAALFKKIASPPLADWLAAHDIASCRAWLLKEITGLHPEPLDRILDEYEHNFR